MTITEEITYTKEQKRALKDRVLGWNAALIDTVFTMLDDVSLPNKEDRSKLADIQLALSGLRTKYGGQLIADLPDPSTPETVNTFDPANYS